MLYLAPQEAKLWAQLGSEVLSQNAAPGDLSGAVQKNLRSMFHFHAGSLLAAAGREAQAKQWFSQGALIEEEGLFSNAFISSFLKRHGGKLTMPAVCFADPRPFVHFTTTPPLKKARENFIKFCCHSLPETKRPFKVMDLGTGNGALLAELLVALRACGKIHELGEILLVDSSPAMVELATRTVSAALPGEKVATLTCRIQDAAAKLDGHYDLAISSLAYHHMPFETKLVHLDQLKGHLDHFILFEMDGDNDRHDLGSPELSCAVYQSYGRVMDFIFAHDAPVEVAQMAVDCFLMVEEISFLTQPRGVRSDYHMPRQQWHQLFAQSFKGEFACLLDSTCYSDEFLDLFALHYGRV